MSGTVSRESAPPLGEPASVGLRTLVALAWPLVLARSTQAVITLADTFQVRHLGPEALVVSATGGLNVFGVVIFFMGTVFIVQSFVAQLRGQGRLDETPAYAWYGGAIALLAGLAAFALMPAIGPLLAQTDFAPSVVRDMTRYMDIRLMAVAAIVGTEVLSNFYGGLGNTRYAMVAAVVSMVLNVILNWVFINGNWGAPAMGTDGAALASTLASFGGFFTLVILFALGRGGVPKRRWPSGLRVREFWRVLSFGVPNGFNWLVEFAAFQLFLNIVFAKLGSDASAAMNVVLAVNMIGFMPAFGLGSAAAILCANAIGAGQPDQVPRIVRLALLCTAIWMGALGVIYLVAARPIAALFATDARGAGMVAVAVTMLRVSSVWQLVDGVGLTLGEVLRGAGDTRWPAVARFVLAWGVFFPVSWSLVTYAGAGPLLTTLVLALYLGLLSIAFWWRFRSGAWRRVRLVEPKLFDEPAEVSNG